MNNIQNPKDDINGIIHITAGEKWKCKVAYEDGMEYYRHRKRLQIHTGCIRTIDSKFLICNHINDDLFRASTGYINLSSLLCIHDLN